MKTLEDVVVGDYVIRTMFPEVNVTLVVTDVLDDRIVCGMWEFCRETGHEIDEELGISISRIVPSQ